MLKLWNVKTLLEYNDVRKQEEAVTHLYFSAAATVQRRMENINEAEGLDKVGAFDTGG